MVARHALSRLEAIHARSTYQLGRLESQEIFDY